MSDGRLLRSVRARSSVDGGHYERVHTAQRSQLSIDCVIRHTVSYPKAISLQLIKYRNQTTVTVLSVHVQSGTASRGRGETAAAWCGGVSEENRGETRIIDWSIKFHFPLNNPLSHFAVCLIHWKCLNSVQNTSNFPFLTRRDGEPNRKLW